MVRSADGEGDSYVVGIEEHGALVAHAWVERKEGTWVVTWIETDGKFGRLLVLLRALKKEATERGTVPIVGLVDIEKLEGLYRRLGFDEVGKLMRWNGGA